MAIQDDAASSLADALTGRGLGTVTRTFGMTPSVSVQGAVVYFKFGQLGELVTEVVFEGQRPEKLNYMPTAAGSDALAEYIAERLAGGGRPPSQATS